MSAHIPCASYNERNEPCCYRCPGHDGELTPGHLVRSGNLLTCTECGLVMREGTCQSLDRHERELQDIREVLSQVFSVQRSWFTPQGWQAFARIREELRRPEETAKALEIIRGLAPGYVGGREPLECVAEGEGKPAQADRATVLVGRKA